MASLRSAARASAPMRSLTELVDRRVAAALDRAAATPGPDDGVEQVRRELAEVRARMRSMEVLFDSAGRGMARLPSPANLDTAAREIAEITGDAAAAKRSVHVAFRLLIAMESLGVGRIAGGTMNICGKLATIPLLRAPNDDLLEIGTLYGLFAAALLRMIERTGGTPRLTVVDPLIGTQHQTGATMNADASGTPVTEAAVRTNLALAGAAGTGARVQVGFSTDEQVRRAVSDREYGTIVVDGDHSYEGVVADLEWAEQVVAPGGVVVLDDYGDPKWAGVQRALEDHLAKPTRLTMLGRVATSGYLRAT